MEKKIPEYNTADLYPHRKALSSTQFLDYEKSPKDFYMRWVIGAGREKTIPMDIGRIFSALYANRSLDFRSLLAEIKAPKRYSDLFARAIACMPILKGGAPETPLKVKHNGWELRATLDDFIEEFFVIVENKTGQTIWDQERVNFSDQITFQAFVHWKKYGVIPRKIIVNWVDCRPNPSKLIHTHQTSRSIKHLKMFEKRINMVIKNLEVGNFTKNLY